MRFAVLLNGSALSSQVFFCVLAVVFHRLVKLKKLVNGVICEIMNFRSCIARVCKDFYS